MHHISLEAPLARRRHRTVCFPFFLLCSLIASVMKGGALIRDQETRRRPRREATLAFFADVMGALETF